jgi:hypothetical protein
MPSLAYIHSLNVVNALAPRSIEVASSARHRSEHGDTQDSPGWVCLHQDPNTTGLHSQGRWQADIEVATNAPLVLLAQILPTRIEIEASQKVRAVCIEDYWIELGLRQFPPTHPALSGLSMIELTALKASGAEVKVVKCVKASPMPMEMMSAFTLGYRLKHGKIVVEVNSDSDKQCVTRMDLTPFGETLPWVKLRSGKQPQNTGISRAKFQQKISWST